VTIDFSPGATSGNMTVFGYNGCAGGPPSTPLSIMVAGLPSTAGQVVGPDTIARGATGIGYAVPTVVNATGYEWMIPPGVVITSGLNTNSILVDFTGSALTGTISVYGTNDCGFGAVSPLFPVTVADPPSPPFIFLVADSLISNYSEGNQWFLDGNPIPGAMGKVYHATQSGWYWATVTRYGVQSDTSNNIQLTMTGLGEPEEGTVTVYPVPNNGEFTISTGSSLLLPCTLEIYNQLGTKVYEWKDGSGNGNREKTIQLKNMPGGVYTLIFRNLQKQFVRRIVITR
ncbi:MAG: T9SS type A sorting domain-containing protein, partial [Bacteroidota bacterium]